tara:strand:- start:60 stop:284 length:225 start_codon:yes stop_codon:yes gene_type:complete
MKIKRYNNNLIQVDNKIISFETHVATIKEGNKLKLEKWEIERDWNGSKQKITSSPITTKHINQVANELSLTIIK